MIMFFFLKFFLSAILNYHGVCCQGWSDVQCSRPRLLLRPLLPHPPWRRRRDTREREWHRLFKLLPSHPWRPQSGWLISIIPVFHSDAIASPSTYPCQWVSQRVSDSFRLEIAIASPSFVSLFQSMSFLNQKYNCSVESFTSHIQDHTSDENDPDESQTNCCQNMLKKIKFLINHHHTFVALSLALVWPSCSSCQRRIFQDLKRTMKNVAQQ